MFEYSGSKEYLARLLANENINVVRSSTANTAWFDLKNRTMTLPMWKTSEDVYDLLTLHEISHALNTPQQGWHDSVTVDGLPKSYLNIIEDVRIERLITKRYAGAARVMRNGYAEIDKEDIFGIRKNSITVADLPLIDRINIHYKLGSHVAVPFAEEERVWLDKIEAIETWEQVVELCKELYASEKVKAEEKSIDAAEEYQESDESSDDSQESFVAGESQESSDDNQENQGSFSSDESQETSDKIEDNQGNQESDESSDDTTPSSNQQLPEQDNLETPTGNSALDPLDSFTDNEYRRNFEELERNLIDKEAGRYNYYTVGTADYNKYLVPCDRVRARLSNARHLELFISEFTKQHSDVVNNMVKEFEAKKRATSVARQQYAKTGRLDTKKVFKYQIAEDIFRRNMIESKGKNHGMVMLVDWSGSMSDKIYNTFVQTAVLAMFCRKAGIPFSVQLFSDCHNGDYTPSRQDYSRTDYVVDQKLSLLEVLNSQSKERDFMRDLANFALLSLRYVGRYNRTNLGFSVKATEEVNSACSDFRIIGFDLGSTPLNSALLTMDSYVSDFKKRYQLEVTNLVVLTDGFSNTDMKSYYSVITDTKTGKVYRVGSNPGRGNIFESNIMYDILRTRHSSSLNIVGYFITNTTEIKRLTYMFDKEDKFSNKIGKTVVITRNPHMMADRYFLVASNSLDIEDDWDIQVTEDTKVSEVKSSFKKHMKGKKDSRLVVGKFIESISQKL
jgi:hypothetical protein